MKLIWGCLAFVLVMIPHSLNFPADPDLWWHLKAGVDLLQTGGLAAKDIFSFTYPGAAWINHEWLSELVMAWAYQWGGESGLYLLRTVLWGFLSVSFLALCWLRFPFLFAVILGGAVALPYLSVFSYLRVHLFTSVLMIAYLLCLEAYRRFYSRLLWALPVLMILWVNLHGGFILGLLIAVPGLVLFYRGLDPARPRPLASEKTEFIVVGILTLAATCVNPYGFGIYRYLFTELTGGHRQITEWQGLQGNQLFHYAFFGLLPLLSFLKARKISRPLEFGLFIFSLIAAIKHGRFMVLLVVFGTLVFFDALQIVISSKRALAARRMMERLNTPFSVLVLVLALAVPASAAVKKNLNARTAFHITTAPNGYPVEAAEFLKHKNLGPNLLLTFQWGGYAIWHLYPEYRVSIDGRNLTVYPGAYVESYVQAYNEGNFKKFHGEAPVNVVLIESRSNLAKFIRRQPEWMEVYRDLSASVFVPRSRANSRGLRPLLRSDEKLREPVFFP